MKKFDEPNLLKYNLIEINFSSGYDKLQIKFPA